MGLVKAVTVYFINTIKKQLFNFSKDQLKSILNWFVTVSESFQTKFQIIKSLK